MQESIIASLVFWLAFGVTAGPFWTAIMEEAKHNSLKSIYINYCKYLLLGWFSINLAIGLIVGILGGINSRIIDFLYFPSFVVICYFGWKVLRASGKQSDTINFNYKAMSLLTWSNPKVWLLVPTGFLTANYTDILLLNIIMFYLIGVPVFLICLYFWATIGRQGAKFIGNKFSYFNAALFFVLLYIFCTKELVGHYERISVNNIF